MTQRSQGNRRGSCFTVRISDEERAELEAMRAADDGPRALGPWLVWRAKNAAGTANPGGCTLHVSPPAVPPRADLPIEKKIILDLCGGSGSWAKPYADAGYHVELVDVERDVRTYVPPAGVHGVLAAPPCTMFSAARNGHHGKPLARDFVEGMACVNACMRIVLQCSPKWWALENPAGLLSRFLGRPRDSFEPHEFGDPWTKRTCLWGSFKVPKRGPFVEPLGSAMDRTGSAARAVTPPGFARAFFEANP